MLPLACQAVLPGCGQFDLQRRDVLCDRGNLRGVGTLHLGGSIRVIADPGHALRPLGDGTFQPLLFRGQRGSTLLQPRSLALEFPFAPVCVLPGTCHSGQLLLQTCSQLPSSRLLPCQVRRMFACLGCGALQVAQINCQARQVSGHVRHLFVQAKPRIVHIGATAVQCLDTRGGEIAFVDRPVQPLRNAGTTGFQVRQARPYRVGGLSRLLELLGEIDDLGSRGRRRVLGRGCSRFGSVSRRGHPCPGKLVVGALER